MAAGVATRARNYHRFRQKPIEEVEEFVPGGLLETARLMLRFSLHFYAVQIMRVDLEGAFPGYCP
jgi:hypothetical protein